ncbi:hypothetical protein B0H14DRAFT_2562419 [Mycena olivaceomarginata]|nr:hypothetical protein B0H14DRAFT_2562419 [Mycena olivaceomarginata]
MTAPFTKHCLLPQVCASAALSSALLLSRPLNLRYHYYSREYRGMPSVTMVISVHDGHHPVAAPFHFIFILHPESITQPVPRAAPHINQSSAPSLRVFVTMPPFGKDRLLLILTSLNPTDPIQGGGGPTQKTPAYKNEANEHPSLKARSSRFLFCESTREEAIMHGSLSEFEKLADLAACSPDSNYPQTEKNRSSTMNPDTR